MRIEHKWTTVMALFNVVDDSGKVVKSVPITVALDGPSGWPDLERMLNEARAKLEVNEHLVQRGGCGAGGDRRTAL